MDPDAFRGVLEGKVPDGSGRALERSGKDGSIEHRPGRDVTLSAPKLVSLVGLVGGRRPIRRRARPGGRGNFSPGSRGMRSRPG